MHGIESLLDLGVYVSRATSRSKRSRDAGISLAHVQEQLFGTGLSRTQPDGSGQSAILAGDVTPASPPYLRALGSGL
jgi:hypothetical protein